MMNVIQIEQLTKRYGRRVGIRDLSLRVEAGMLYGFLGPNGSGKTTTIRVLMGLLKADAGLARLFDLDCWRQGRRIKAEVGYLPGDLRLYPWMTCQRAVRMISRVRHRDCIRPGMELAEILGLELNIPVSKMSHGMRQKLGLILAMAHQPKILILDEPTTALDPLVQDTLFRILRERATNGCTVFFSSHTLSEVDRLCDCVAILRRGRLVANVTLSSLRSRARRAVTIHWNSDADPQRITPPSLLQVYSREKHQWQGSLTGSVKELMQWCAVQPIDDLSIEKPDLNHLFHQYYADSEKKI